MTLKNSALTIASIAGLATAATALSGNTTDDKDSCQSACTMSTQASCGWDKSQDDAAVTMVSLERDSGDAAPNGNIVQVAEQAGQFETLLAAAKAAGLADALTSSGPLTVFAPTDEAFSKLGQSTISSLLKPENREKLATILKYHVVSGDLPASKVLSSNDARTLSGQQIDFSTRDGKVFVDGAQVLSADIEASNGVIHVIDSVIMPETKNIVQVAQGDGRFTILAQAVEAAGLAGALTGDDALTVFAPTDEAFGKLPAGTLEYLLEPENKDTLVKILTYHVVPERVYARDAVGAQRAETLEGSSVRVDIEDGRLTVNDANIVATDIEASNGVIHVIDTVILPEG